MTNKSPQEYIDDCKQKILDTHPEFQKIMEINKELIDIENKAFALRDMIGMTLETILFHAKQIKERVDDVIKSNRLECHED